MADFALLSDHLPDDNSHCGDGHPPLEPQSAATITIEAMYPLELDDDGMPPSDDLKKWVWDPVLKVPLGFLLQISFGEQITPYLYKWLRYITGVVLKVFSTTYTSNECLPYIRF